MAHSALQLLADEPTRQLSQSKSDEGFLPSPCLLVCLRTTRRQLEND